MRLSRILAVGLSLLLFIAAPLSARQDPPPSKPPVRVGGSIKEPKLLKKVEPAYPQEAKDNGIQGMVILEVVIAKDGSISSAKALREAPMLTDAALAAVKQWKYEPTLLEGDPVEVIMVVTVNFSLR